MFEYPLSLQKFRQLYTNIQIEEGKLDSLEHLKTFSIKKNHSDFTFYCENINIFPSDLNLKHPILDLIRNFIEKNENVIFNTLNKKIFIYHENPYNVKIENSSIIGKTDINCRYSHNDKEILFTRIRSLNIIYDDIILPNAFIFNKNNELFLDTKIEKLFNIVSKLKILIEKNENDFYSIEREMIVNLLHMYKKLDTSEKNNEHINEWAKSKKIEEKNKIITYFKNRRLL